jgi:two-component system, sensor histidine kinase and response regulator
VTTVPRQAEVRWQSRAQAQAQLQPQPQACAVAGVLDEAALGRLRDLDPTGANQLMSRVLTAFESSLARLLPQLLQAQGTNDCNAIRHVAHTLKSSSASIGALHLAKLCTELEAAARSGEQDGLDERINAMHGETQSVLLALRQALAVAP